MEPMDNQILMSGGNSNRLSPSGFFYYVFNFDSDNKAILLNMLQYLIFSLIPVIVLLKFVKEYIPEDNDKKDNLEYSFKNKKKIKTLKDPKILKNKLNQMK